jgi:amino acid permease
MTNHNENTYNNKTLLYDNNKKCDLITPTNELIDDIIPKTPCWKRYFGPIRGGSLRGSTFTLASITFGPGCFVFPYAVAQTGPIVALIIFILVALANYYTLYILLEIGFKSQIMDYNALLVKALGRKLEIFYHINNYIGTIGVIVTFQYTVYGFAQDLCYVFFGLEKTKTNYFYILLVCMFCIQIPLNLLQKISALQYASIVGTIAILYSIIVIIFEMPFYLIDFLQRGDSFTLFVPINWNYLDSFSIFMFVFGTHNAIFQVFNELRQPTLERCQKILNRSFLFEFVLYILTAFAGYFSTFDKTPDIFLERPDLENFKPDYFVKFSKLTLFICFHCSMALTNNIMRQSTKFLWFQEREYPFWLDAIIVVLLYSICNALVFFVDNIIEVFGIVGGICACVVCVVNPLLVHINMNSLPKTHYKNLLRYLMLILISIIGVMASVKSILDFINK